MSNPYPAPASPLPSAPTVPPAKSRQHKIRWRLILGEDAEGQCGGLAGPEADMDVALEFLYGREGQGKNRRKADKCQARKGSLDPSSLNVPDWINAVHTLFPQRTIERVEKDALERYKIDELVTNIDLLKRAEPSTTLMKAVMHTKHLMNQEVLAMAREMMRKVVEELMRKLSRPIKSAFLGAADRRKRSNLRVAKNFDARSTIRLNLKYYDPDSGKLFIRTPYFFSRIHRHTDKWQVVILVDESGSMVDSVIHSAVTAAIFFGVKALRTHLVLFDTSIVDVSADCADPVETIMKVQLGGGTDIAQAVMYADKLIDNPRKAIVVLITDFCEGGPPHVLFSACKKLIEQGTILLGLAALDGDAKPNYDRSTAEKIVALGGHVGAMTPGELAEWVAEKVK
ncbi:MAG: VWA domain-containing protein [Candidatus Methylacidiphilales bacterium]|nr:VWA domain-containing protein [Candidatus Methylacidiphilales bacterium]